MTTRSLALMSAVILILVLGVAFLYAVRSQTPPLTAQSPAPPTASVALAANSPTPSGGTPTPALTFVRCGTLAANSITTGQGSGANIYELGYKIVSTTGRRRVNARLLYGQFQMLCLSLRAKTTSLAVLMSRLCVISCSSCTESGGMTILTGSNSLCSLSGFKFGCGGAR